MNEAREYRARKARQKALECLGRSRRLVIMEFVRAQVEFGTPRTAHDNAAADFD